MLNKHYYNCISNRDFLFNTEVDFDWVSIFDDTCTLQNLQELSIYQTHEDINTNLLKLHTLPKLTKLTIWGYNDLKDEGIRNIPNTIKELTLILCFDITHESLLHFTNLTKLNIRYCPNILETLSIQSINLKELSFFTNDYISDTFFTSIGHLVNLEKLVMNYCFSITNEGLSNIVKFPKLHKLYLTDILNLNIEETESILNHESVKINIIFISSLFWKIYKIKDDPKLIFEYDFQYIINQLNTINEENDEDDGIV